MAADPKKPKNVENYDAKQSLQQGEPKGAAADLSDLIARLDKAGGVPISLRIAASGRVETFDLLTDKAPVTVAFPPCAGEMLALIKTTDASNSPLKYKDKDDIVRYFEEYFRFGAPHVIIRGNLFEHINADL